MSEFMLAQATGGGWGRATKAALTLVASLILLFPIVAAAQVTASTSGVTGTVTDPQGAAIAGVTVTLTNTGTGQQLTTTTGENGSYRFSQVQPGQNYKLSFSSQGFQTLELTNVALAVGTLETHSAQLTAGQVTETVTVTEQAGATLNTTDASIGNVLDQRRLVDLPVQIRSSPASLMGLQPGVVGNNVGTGATNRVGSVTGSRADQGNITVDGIDANDQATGQAFATSGNAPIDAIQEFRTVSTNPGASEGRSSGGQIQLITKSGTNEFHGSLREFNRTAFTAANSFFNNRSGVARPQLTRNQFGGSIGGPVYLPSFGEGGDHVWSGKDKLFFFFDYEGRRDAQGVTYTRTVPLQSFREGRIGYLNNTAGCPTNARASTHPQCISYLTPDQVRALDPAGIGVNQALLNFINQRYPAPNDLSAGNGVNTGGFRFNAPSRRADNNYTVRFDGTPTNAQRFFVRASKVSNAQTDTVNTSAALFPGDPAAQLIVTGDYAVATGHNWVITPNLVNQATVGVTRSVLDFPRDFQPTFPQSYAFGVITSPYLGFSAQSREVPVWTYRDDLSWRRGSHSLQLGGSLKTINQMTGLVSDFNFPTVGLGGNLTALNAGLRPANIGSGTTRTGNFDAALALALGVIPGNATRFNYDASGNVLPLGTGRNRDWRYVEWEFYAQDNWKVRNDLTLTAGVRYHIYPAPYETSGAQSIQNLGFDELFNIRQANAAAGIAGNSSEPFLVYNLGGKANDARPFYDTDWNNFGPRLSFAYNPSFEGGLLGALFGDRKMVLRGGGTVTYDRPGGGITFLQDQSTYIFDTVVTTNLAVPTIGQAVRDFPRFTSINTVPINNVAPTPTRPFTPNVNAAGRGIGTTNQLNNYAVDPDFRIPYSFQYSLGIQRELPGNFLLDVSYVGRQGRKLFTLADASQILDFRDPASGQFMLAAFNNLQTQLEGGGAITPIAWFENQVNAANLISRGTTCAQLGTATGLGANCTEIAANLFHDLIVQGGSADLVQQLYANRLLNPNVGLSSQFGTNGFVTNKGSSSYNGMLVSLRRRFSQGLQFDANYTWSHSIDNQSTVANTVTSGGLVCDVTNLRVCRGNSDFDIRHLFNANGIWELPVGRGKWLGGDMPGWANTFLGGWQVSGIFTARSGLPYDLASGVWSRTFIYNAGNGVPAVITGDLNAFRPSIHDAPGGIVQFYADPEAAAAATTFPRHGQAGQRNVLTGNPFWNLDTAVLKNFRLPWSETQKLQLRWEAYNAFNKHHYALPNNFPTSTAFGQVTGSASTARVMQFGIRWDF